MVPCSQQPAKMNSVNDNEHNILSYVSCRALQMKPTDSSLQITRPVGMTGKDHLLVTFNDSGYYYHSIYTELLKITAYGEVLVHGGVSMYSAIHS